MGIDKANTVKEALGVNNESSLLNKFMEDITKRIKDFMDKIKILDWFKAKEENETVKKTTEDLNLLKNEFLKLTKENKSDGKLTDNEIKIWNEINENKEINKYMEELQKSGTVFNIDVIEKEKTEMIYSIKSEINEVDGKLTEEEMKNIINKMQDIEEIEKDETLVEVINEINGTYTITEIVTKYNQIEKEGKTKEIITKEILDKLNGDNTEETQTNKEDEDT